MIHSATTTLITQPAPISTALGSSPGFPPTSTNHGRCVKTCVPASNPIAYADLGRAIGDSRFPAFAALLTTPSDGRPRTMDESFDFCLQRVLDGIELYVNSVKAKSAAITVNAPR
jgi:hypothetical protein